MQLIRLTGSVLVLNFCAYLLVGKYINLISVSFEYLVSKYFHTIANIFIYIMLFKNRY